MRKSAHLYVGPIIQDLVWRGQQLKNEVSDSEMKVMAYLYDMLLNIDYQDCN